MKTTSWVIIGILIVAIIVVFPLTPPNNSGRPQATPSIKTFPYRPSESMGSNKISV
jgi:hypothetical protein